MAATALTADGVQGFLGHILDYSFESKTVAYRGHSRLTYKIQAKIYRNDSSKKAEESIISELLAESPDDFKDDKTTLEQLVRAQHYGLPTRLLDVSLNPLVALYFACDNPEKASEDGVVLRFSISPDRVKLFDSDTVSCISNVARLTYNEKNEIFKLFAESKGKGGVRSISVEKFNEREDVKRLVQFIRLEKPYFQNQIVPLHLNRLYFIKPKKNNRRIIAQSGAFICSGLLKIISEESSTAFGIESIVIPWKSKKQILKELDTLHINQKTLFPEVYRVSEYIAERYSR